MITFIVLLISPRPNKRGLSERFIREVYRVTHAIYTQIMEQGREHNPHYIDDKEKEEFD